MLLTNSGSVIGFGAKRTVSLSSVSGLRLMFGMWRIGLLAQQVKKKRRQSPAASK
jgi:hypothetical protein